MEKNEIDILNNKLTQESFTRHQDIINKLLESEKAEREQGDDKKMESVERILNSNDTSHVLEYKKN